jgi:hypothetical protein
MKISINKIFHNTLEWMCLALFYGNLSQYLFKFQITPLATLCLPILAVFFGFSALLYNRARAIPDGPEQRRTLYAAERALQATTLYFYALLLGLIITAILSSFNLVVPKLQSGEIYWPLSFYFAPAMLALFAFSCFMLSLRAVSHRKLRSVKIREIMRRIR